MFSTLSIISKQSLTIVPGAITAINRIPCRNYYKHKVEEATPYSYRKSTTIISNDCQHTHHTKHTQVTQIKCNHEQINQIAKVNDKNLLVEVGVPVFKLLLKEWQENEELRNWVRNTFKNTSVWINQKIKTAFIQIERDSFVLLPESSKETDEQKIRKALNLPMTGNVDDWQIIGLSSDKYSKEELSKKYKERLMQWHPDHNIDNSELSHLVIIKVKESFNKLK